MKLDAKFHTTDMVMDADFDKADVVHDGENGATFTPSVAKDGTLSWENDRGLPNPEPVNIMGPPGPAYTLTKADKTEMVAAVIAALPVYNGEVVAV